jgi:hypothetical protein
MTGQTVLALPYVHLNLRFNPFGELAPEERAELAVVGIDVERIVSRLGEPGFAIQVLGRQGRGKSSHLFALRRHFPDAPYTHIALGAPVPDIPYAPVHFIDEMQRIPRSRRMRIFRRPASFVIGSHRDHRWEFRRAGLVFETVRLRGLTVERLQAIVDRRIDWARRDADKPVPRLSEAALATLIARYGDDVRAIESHLYEVFQRLEDVCDVQV